MDKRKCIMNIKLLLNKDGTVCLGLEETNVNAKITVTKNELKIDLKELFFYAGVYSSNQFTFDCCKKK